MKILITNDDGIEAQGLKELVKVLSSKYRVFVVAPEKRIEGLSGAVTFDSPIKVERHPLSSGEKMALVVSGTPADCMILALDVLVPNPDLVISGINDEPNVGDDIRLSGTIGACREATFSGFPSIAISLDYGGSKNFFEGATFIAKKFIEIIEDKKVPPGIFFNVNVPNIPKEKIKGIKFVRLGRRRYRDRVHGVSGNPEEEYFYINGIQLNETYEDTEDYALKHNYIAITPLNIDNTDYKFLEVMKKWKIKLN